MDRREQITNEVWSAITHGIGVGLSIWLLVLLTLKGIATQNIVSFTAYLVYGLCLLSLYLVSTLFHCLYFTKARRLFQAFDHSSIYLLIAGTYMPYCLVGIGGKFGWGLWIAVALLMLFGILYHALAKPRYQIVETVICVLAGWLCVLGFKPLFQVLGFPGLLLLLAGGIAFTLGAVVYSLKLKYVHIYWHLLVILGSALMFCSIYFYL